MFSRLKKLLNRSERASVGNAYMEQANGHEFVDLGLSVLWASMNVGAKNIYEFGLTYKWGETKPSACSREQYKFDIRPEVDLKLPGVVYPLSKYVVYSNNSTTDYRNVLESCDDAAYSNFGGSWRMPTSAEWEELFSCEWALVTINEMIDAIELWTAMYENKAPWLKKATAEDKSVVKSLGLPQLIASEKARTALIEFESEITTPIKEVKPATPNYMAQNNIGTDGKPEPQVATHLVTEDVPKGPTDRADFLNN
jgi:hypothetical protein